MRDSPLVSWCFDELFWPSTFFRLSAAIPDRLDHWHNEPRLLGGLIFLGWLYAILTGLWRGKLTALLVLSTVKFMFVIFFFMHLRWDKVFCALLFFIGLILAGFTMYALLHLSATDAVKPLTAAALNAPAALVAHA